MSMKIFNGFRFASSDLSTIHAQIMAWREEIAVIHLQELSRLIATHAVFKLDAGRLFPGQMVESPLFDAWQSVMDRQVAIRKSGLRDPDFDFSMDISVLPHESGVYGVVFCERANWIGMWMDKPFVEDFSYWNHSEKPDDIDEAEWDRREKIWNSIIGSARLSAFSMAGFSADCTHENEWPSTDQVLALLPTLEQRLSFWSRHAVNQSRFHELEASSSPGAAACELVRWSSTEDAASSVASMRTMMAKVLPEVVTRDDLLGSGSSSRP